MNANSLTWFSNHQGHWYFWKWFWKPFGMANEI